jgi:hypothetical protein
MIEEMRINPGKDKTERGFSILEFLDGYGKMCSMLSAVLNDSKCRMHLSRDQAKAIALRLLHWVEFGEIAKEQTDIVWMTTGQHQLLVDCLGPASEDILNSIFPDRVEEDEEEE